MSSEAEEYVDVFKNPCTCGCGCPHTAVTTYCGFCHVSCPMASKDLWRPEVGMRFMMDGAGWHYWIFEVKKIERSSAWSGDGWCLLSKLTRDKLVTKDDEILWLKKKIDELLASQTSYRTVNDGQAQQINDLQKLLTSTNSFAARLETELKLQGEAYREMESLVLRANKDTHLLVNETVEACAKKICAACQLDIPRTFEHGWLHIWDVGTKKYTRCVADELFSLRK